jgi:hypothetical protein
VENMTIKIPKWGKYDHKIPKKGKIWPKNTKLSKWSKCQFVIQIVLAAFLYYVYDSIWMETVSQNS